MSCLSSCDPNAINTYTLQFTINSTDVSAISPSIGDFWNKLQNMNLYGLTSTSYNSGATINIAAISQALTVPTNCSLTTSNNGGVWIFLSTFANWFGFSVSRLCNLNVTPEPNLTNITGVTIKITILPPSDNTKVANDKLSAKCIGEWMIDFLKQYDSTNDAATNPPVFVGKTKVDIIKKCSGFSSEINSEINNNIENYNNIPNNILNAIEFTNIIGYENTTENYSGVVGNSGSKLVKSPSTLYEYLFMFAFPVCFVGSIFYGVVSVINLDPSSIIVNKNIGVAINIYILACSVVSMFVWYNIPNPILVSSVLNPATVRPTLN